MKQYLLKVWMTAALSLLALGGVWGQTAPKVVSLSPANGATVDPPSDFTVTFSEDIRFNPNGRFYYDIYVVGEERSPFAYGTVEDGKVTRGLISISGSDLSLSFSGLDYSKSYYIVVEPNAIQSLGGEGFVGIAANEWTFTTEIEPIPADPPYVETDGYFPAPGTPEVSRDTKLRLTFNEKIEFGDLSALFLIHRDGSVRPLLSGSDEVSIS